MVIVHVGLDRGTKKSLLVECFESLPLYFGIVSSRKDYFTLTVVSCNLQNPLGARTDWNAWMTQAGRNDYQQLETVYLSSGTLDKIVFFTMCATVHKVYVG